MKHVQLLDCTLRDGAYLIDKKFGDNTIHGIIEGLVKAKIDVIEIGFFQNEGFGEGKTVFKNSADAKRFIPDDKGNSMFTVLADYSRFDVHNLDECDPKSIDAVRECFFKIERYDAIKACHDIKQKGYKVFVQPVDILGYTDKELIEFIDLVNELEPYCLSIVDTFGSMYQEDLHRVFELIDHNLIPTTKIGFHSHNNMQLSSALSQEFVRMSIGKREVCVDGTINGMGRGAGNTPTELVAQYLVSRFSYNYDIDALLDIVDDYMDNIRNRCTWGYNTPYFIAGCYSAHVNNIAYLRKRNGIRSKDIRYVLNQIGAQKRKRYDYDLLESTYLDLMKSDIDDKDSLSKLSKRLEGQNVLIIAPGETSKSEVEKITNYINDKQPVIISLNFIHESIKQDLVYMSNVRRYNQWKFDEKFQNSRKVLTSNIQTTPDEMTYVISYSSLIKCGWEHFDNSTIMLLRLLDKCPVRSIGIAGFDGYDLSRSNYANDNLELSSIKMSPIELNKDNQSLLDDFFETRNSKAIPVYFVTSSKYKINV